MSKVSITNRKDRYGVQTYEKYRVWEVQPKPYKAPLPFTFRERYRTMLSFHGLDEWSEQNLGPDKRDPVSAFNKCYDKLKGQLGESSTWANNLVEGRQSLDMLTGRLNQVGSFANALRKGQFSRAANILKLAKTPRGVSSSKSYGNNFLEYHFGWEPLVQDIGGAMDVLQSTDFGGQRLFATVRERFSFYNRYETDWLSEKAYDIVNENGTIQVKMGCIATVSNANAFLANQLGFVNPAAVLWEAVPYSFVVDWFANVGQCLSSFTDFVGVTLEFPYTTVFQRGTRNHYMYQPANPGWTFAEYKTSAGSSVFCNRYPYIQGPRLEVKPFKGFSFTRGVTAVSLLLQKL